jgi:predicted RNA-binding Zn ribbon-like protein
MADRYQFDRCGGHLALDFANAVTGRHTDSPIDRIPDYDALVEFGVQMGIVKGPDAARLRRFAEGAPVEAAAIRARAVELREALYRTFVANAAGKRAAPRDLETIDEAIHHLRLSDRFEWEWRKADAPDAFLGPVVRAGLELLLSEERARVHVCDADDCEWLFLDTSKNGRRRWCDMKACGNRVKARRFYKRHRAG